jgi:restriction system protein
VTIRRELLVDILGIAARLRPRIALSLALLCWLPLHVIAVETAEIPASEAGSASVNADGPAQFAHLVAATLQYLMPGALLAGTLVAAMRRRRRKSQGRERPRTVPVGAMREEDFAARLVAAFRARGYEVLTRKAAPPGGADWVAVRGAERFLVQRSHWQAWQVGDALIREFAAEISALQVHGGFVVTGGWFSRKARELAAQGGIELVDGDALGAWFGVVAAANSPRGRTAAGASVAHAGAMAPTALIAPTALNAPSVLKAPTCPKCGATMQQQQAMRGKMQGQYYWACAGQPKCRGILPCRTQPEGAHYGAALTH